MIDGHTYRLSQEIARRSISTWELAQIHHVAFGDQAWPQKIPTIQDLPQVMNVMHENRFDVYCKEWAGFTSEEIQLLVNALVEYVQMCLKTFPNRKVKLPLSTMISGLSIFLKLRAYKPNFETLLEIGPGSGNMAFFLKYHKPLKDYSTVEACEAYYLLQSMVYSENFPYTFKEHAFPNLESGQETFTVCDEIETPNYYEAEEKSRLNHYPWWQIGKLAHKESHFDLITTNANLMELSERALKDYLALMKRTLKPEGVILSQCLGSTLAREPRELIEFMKKEGFGAHMISSENHYWDLDIKGKVYTKYFALRNAVWVSEKHPQYEAALERMHFRFPIFDAQNESLAAMFGLTERKTHNITASEIVQKTKDKLDSIAS